MRSVNKLLAAKDRSVAAAPFYGEGKEAEYRIEGNPGLVLVVFPPDAKGRSKRVWRCYYSRTLDGQRLKRKVRLGTYPSTGLADARARAARIMAEVDQGRDPFVEELADKAGFTPVCQSASHLSPLLKCGFAK